MINSTDHSSKLSCCRCPKGLPLSASIAESATARILSFRQREACGSSRKPRTAIIFAVARRISVWFGELWIQDSLAAPHFCLTERELAPTPARVP